MKRYWAYIMSNKSRRLYVGFTTDLYARVIKHKEKLYPGSFTARYNFDTLVWYEEYSQVISARMREVEIKGWRREKKLALILAENLTGLTSAWNGVKTQVGNLSLTRVRGSSAILISPKTCGAGPSPSRGDAIDPWHNRALRFGIVHRGGRPCGRCEQDATG